MDLEKTHLGGGAEGIWDERKTGRRGAKQKETRVGGNVEKKRLGLGAKQKRGERDQALQYKSAKRIIFCLKPSKNLILSQTGGE